MTLDIWKNTIHHDDCFNVLPKIPNNSIDMILCDLPYGVTAAQWDKIIDLDKLWIEYKRICKDNAAIVLFSQVPFNIKLANSNLKWLKYEWIWEKNSPTGFLNANRMPLKKHENILVFYKKLPTYNPQKSTGHKPQNSWTSGYDKMKIYGKANKNSGGGETDRFPTTVLKFKTDKQKNQNGKLYHSSQKPLALCEYLIKTYTNENDLVLDNCMGSGTTCLAAKNLNRNYIGIEKEEIYFNMAKERIK